MSVAPVKQPPRPTLAAVFAEHYAFVRERLRGLGVAAADLDDATQDVFEVLVRRIADHDPQRPIRAWMAGMARKVARRYRDRGRRGIVALDERRVGVHDSPEDRAARAEAWKVLQRFVDELEPERWSVFVLSEIEGLRGSEIAAELGVNLNTVYARLRSARQAFERTLRRHRARERRGLLAVFVWPSAGSRRWAWAGSMMGLSGVALGSAIMLGSSQCGPDDEAIGERASAESKLAAASPAEPRAAPRSIAAPNLRAPASRSEPTADAEPEWIGAGSGFSNNHNAKGEPYTLSIEKRYRLEGDRVIVEVAYIGDDDAAIEGITAELRLDGLELVDGQLAWELALAAGEVETVSTTLRASREGVVQLHMGTPNGWTFKWVNEHGQLRRCNDGECDGPRTTKEQLSGERITVHVHNRCEVEKEFVLFAGYPELLPDESVPIYSLQPDERRTMQIDAAQWFLNRHPDGHIGGGVHTDEDGAHVTFTGDGETCSSMSTRSPNLPADGGPPPNPSAPKSLLAIGD